MKSLLCLLFGCHSYKLRCKVHTTRGNVEFELEVCQLRHLDLRGAFTTDSPYNHHSTRHMCNCAIYSLCQMYNCTAVCTTMYSTSDNHCTAVNTPVTLPVQLCVPCCIQQWHSLYSCVYHTALTSDTPCTAVCTAQHSTNDTPCTAVCTVLHPPVTLPVQLCVPHNTPPVLILPLQVSAGSVSTETPGLLRRFVKIS